MTPLRGSILHAETQLSVRSHSPAADMTLLEIQAARHHPPRRETKGQLEKIGVPHPLRLNAIPPERSPTRPKFRITHSFQRGAAFRPFLITANPNEAAQARPLGARAGCGLVKPFTSAKTELRECLRCASSEEREAEAHYELVRHPVTEALRRVVED
jgi:hypothetical protein